MILIIGAGISGLILACELEKKGVDYLLLESGPKPGGYMKSLKVKEYLLELGPNTVLANSELKAYFCELGLNDQMLIPDGHSKERYVLKDGKLKKMPSGPFSFLFGNFFSWKTKKAIFNEMGLKNSGKSNETIGEFFERRFNKELVDYAVNPFVSGIFAGDPYRLLIDKTFPFLSGMEKKYGSVVKGFLKSRSDKKESIIFKNGSEKLIEAVAKEVHNTFYNAKVLSLKKKADKFVVSYLRNQKVELAAVDKVVITSPAFVAADILKEFNSEISDKISAINYCPMVKVFLGFKKKDIEHSPEGFGVLNPDCEKQFSLGTIWNSSINPLSCPADHFLFTVMVGGANNVGNTKEVDKIIISRVSSELKRIYKIRYNPDFTYVHRIENAIPQYDIKMNGLDAMVDKLEQEGIFICANWYKGASVSDCIRKATNLSESMNKEEELALAV